jgi:hypothetical protein
MWLICIQFGRLVDYIIGAIFERETFGVGIILSFAFLLLA